ncbi:MAG: hypothetical protein H6733_10660 [Alphaproteobacteria bacterium]|nr:hypothetical protein [Alphaproteobacteria bacterium]
MSRSLLALFAVLLAVAPSALAQGGEDATEGDAAKPDDKGVSNADKPEEVIVYGDPFARWDGTRWFVQTQIGMPLPYTFYAELNHEFDAIALDLRMVMGCEKTWRQGKKRYEVDCHIEDIALQGAGYHTVEAYGDEILTALQAKLAGADLQLIVADDGRIVDVGLEGLETGRDRERAIKEQARMILVRAISGFHMKLPPHNQIRKGQWVEYDSTLFELPVTTNGGLDRPGSTASSSRTNTVFNTMSGSYIIHQLDRYKGHLVVQSLGEGTILVGDSDTSDESYFKLKLDGVAIYDEGSGIMSERVWTLRGRTSAGSALGDGRADPIYFHNGRFRLLTGDEKPDVGATGLVSRPGVTATGSLPAWRPFE